ncbi:MAG: hypothetical protein H0V13_00820 [Nocardioidaceae bacterium]|nr:hypothetical protein [Nocardioidaceae bacterium]
MYRELARLEELDLIGGTHVPQTSAPDKRVFEITDSWPATHDPMPSGRCSAATAKR